MGDTQLFKVQSVPSQGKATTPRQRFSFSFLHAAPFAEHTVSVLLLDIPVLSFTKTQSVPSQGKTTTARLVL